MAQLEYKVSAACPAPSTIAFKINQQELCGPNEVTAISLNQIKIVCFLWNDYACFIWKANILISFWGWMSLTLTCLYVTVTEKHRFYRAPFSYNNSRQFLDTFMARGHFCFSTWHSWLKTVQGWTDSLMVPVWSPLSSVFIRVEV